MMAERQSTNRLSPSRFRLRIAVALVVCAIGVSLAAWKSAGNGPAGVAPTVIPNADTKSEQAGVQQVRVDVIKPSAHGLGRTATLPGDVHVFESAELYSKVSGYLAEQNVDIGDHVKRGQLLAVIDVPESATEVEEATASLERAKSVVTQNEARLQTARAEADAAVAQIGQMEAEVRRAIAQQNLRTKEYLRIKNLNDLHAIEEQIVDEKEDAKEVAIAAVGAAEAAVVSARAQATAAKARIGQADADVLHAKADVEVSRAKLEKAQVFLDYTKISSPYNGVITLRSFHRGDFISARSQGAADPLLTVARTDLMRVVVQLPDLDVPSADVGDKAVVTIDALPGKEFVGKISRTADAEDRKQKTMRTEIDLPNPHGELRAGMYGTVTIELEPPSDAMTIPSGALVGKTTDGKGKVYVVREGKARLVPIEMGQDNGLRMEVLSGLNPSDEVVISHTGAIGDGTPVTVIVAPIDGSPRAS
jgi:RND family efflux transporter MFP subunit